MALHNVEETIGEPSLGFYVAKARNVLVSSMTEAAKPLGITAQQVGVILFLSVQRESTPVELSRVMSHDGGALTRLLDRLERKGLVSRTRSEQDRRIVNLSLTDQGREVAVLLPELSAGVLGKLMHGISPSEHARLIDLLGRIIENGLKSN
jgi:DNA-binding MarR family transcriptional regulator